MRTSQRFGDVWIKSKRSAILAVPSVVVPRHFNYLLNPKYPDLLTSIRIVDKQPFALDVRLFDTILRYRRRKAYRPFAAAFG